MFGGCNATKFTEDGCGGSGDLGEVVLEGAVEKRLAGFVGAIWSKEVFEIFGQERSFVCLQKCMLFLSK
jgi:hypothetical protein